ncbi:AraC family transcriptional regulator [Pseudovibrio sp. Tun.PSC04-5.I4]|uniref:helix-turn-helix domain-containing protein n=1 Tax=Pseudovibrio sp. Tun.PSC04-5.I4 TaxID=1798213 RepID=UPI000882AD66|nr:AraC family transcriptional regulator [Pseudovibrio sp. Tun.PSC04-5.I4]SDR29646.1 AraC-type DNA-binding protein [Pseudovibrio sp. Tun.PSC04-5.I4]
MRSYLEKVPDTEEGSFKVMNRRLEEGIPFSWHHHPEYELTLTLNSEGQRYIGDHVGEYGDSDLVLIGPNLPHTWASSDRPDDTEPHVALVIWFEPEWIERITKEMSELRQVKRLFQRALAGLSFSDAARHRVIPLIKSFFKESPLERLLLILRLLAELSEDECAVQLAHDPVILSGAEGGNERIDRVLTQIHSDYTRSLSLEEIAETAALSVSGVHRLFLRHTGQSISEYLKRIRIGDACSQLASSDAPISMIAQDVGYSALANFNRQFRAVKGMTPREYRARFRG